MVLLGPSGSGKSTLLNMLGGIDSPISGEIWIRDIPVHTLDQDQLAKWRGRNVGIVFQFFQLLPRISPSPIFSNSHSSEFAAVHLPFESDSHPATPAAIFHRVWCLTSMRTIESPSSSIFLAVRSTASRKLLPPFGFTSFRRASNRSGSAFNRSIALAIW